MQKTYKAQKTHTRTKNTKNKHKKTLENTKKNTLKKVNHTDKNTQKKHTQTRNTRDTQKNTGTRATPLRKNATNTKKNAVSTKSQQHKKHKSQKSPDVRKLVEVEVAEHGAEHGQGSLCVGGVAGEVHLGDVERRRIYRRFVPTLQVADSNQKRKQR